MSDQDLFNSDTPKAVPEADQLLDLVKREDGTRKYNTLEDLAKGASHAQKHISDLEKRIKELEEGQDKSAFEAILEKLKAPVPAAAPAPAAVPTGVPLEQIEQAVQALEAKKTAQSNAEQIRNDLVKVAGSEEAAAKLFREKAASVGLSTQELSLLAMKSPTAARAILSLGEGPKAPTKTSGTVISPGVQPSQPERKKVMLGGASTADLIEAFRKHKPQ